jgi:hypothetical protein
MFQRELFRPTPVLPAEAMRTHQISAPAATHWRRATCAEVECSQYLNGWATPLAGLDEGDIWQAKNSGRKWVEVDTDAGPALVFEPGQPCFAAVTHRKRLDRPELFIARDGDWRGNPRGTDPLRFSGADSWADSLQTHLEKFNQ